MDDQLPPPSPLHGVRVLDVGTLIAGPFSATLLADFGADVIKVEQPGVGDPLRQSGHQPAPDTSLAWLIDARNKRSVTANLRVAEGQALLLRLVDHADVLVENFTPGTLDAWGLGWDVLHERNPRLVMVRVSGFGQTGPYHDRPGYDRIALGFSGYLYPTGYPDRAPVRPAFPTADYNTATFAALATMMALYWRDHGGGEGQLVDLGLYEAPFRITGDLVAAFTRLGKVRERVGNRNPGFTPAGNFLSRDGIWLQIAAGGDGVWRRLTVAIERPELAEDPRYARARDRQKRADELEALLADWIGSLDAADAEARLLAANVPVGPILTAADLVADPHYAARENIVTVQDERVGEVPMPAPTPKLGTSPGRVRHAGPPLGAHNREVYGDLLGLDDATLDDLAARGVI